MPIRKKREIIKLTEQLFEITLYIQKSDKEEYNRCLDQINGLYMSKKPIPYKLLKEWFSFFYPRTQTEIIQKRLLVNHAIDKTIDHFLSDRHYQFKATCRQGYRFDFKQFIKDMGNVYFKTVCEKEINDEIEILDKDAAIQYLYVSIYINTLDFNTPEKMLMTHFQKGAIAAYFAMQLDYKLTKEEFPSNKELFGAVANAIRNINWKEYNIDPRFS